ncbi:MAG: hypothetical protein AAFQ43_11330 [Bacteroidota bacterium]
MPDWPELYSRYRTASTGSERYAVVVEARHAVAEKGPDRWSWLSAALQDGARRDFVARVFERQPVPKALFDPMLDAALASDPSGCRWFIQPLIGTFGLPVVREALKQRAASPEAYGKVDYWLVAVHPRR